MDFERLVNLTEQRVKDFHEMQNLGVHTNNGEFIPAGVHYPPITHYPKIDYDEMFKGYKISDDGFTDVYVHIPFCQSKCIFCHYPSRYNSTDEEKDKYLEALEKEMHIYKNVLGGSIKPRAILIGGGTPTDLTLKQLSLFLEFFTANCDMSAMRQFNYDVSPSTLIGKDGIGRLKLLKEFGVNRLTIGIQSLNDEILNLMNRAHNKREALESIKNSLDMGFQTNIEFIYGHPGQTLKNWYEDLKQIVELGTEEIQFYRLKIEAYGDQQGSIKYYKTHNPTKMPSPEDTMRMKQMVFDYLKEYGYTENLRRVFTKKKSYISLYAYNQCCMLYDQIGLGLTAFSSLRNRFVLNTPDFNEYYERINNGLLPFNRGYVRNSEAQQRWAAILPLKNYFIRKQHYKKVTGINIENSIIYPVIQKLKEYDLVVEDDKTIKLTEKGGFFSDEVVGLFYDTKFIPKEKSYFNNGPLNPYTLNEK